MVFGAKMRKLPQKVSKYTNGFGAKYPIFDTFRPVLWSEGAALFGRERAFARKGAKW